MTTTTTKQLIQHSSSLDPWGRNKAALGEHAALVQKLNEEARENWDNEAWHRQVAIDLATSLDYGFTLDNLFASYVQVQNVGEFDRIRIRERRGLKVFYTSRGGYIEESQIRSEEWELPRDTMGFHVSEHIDKLRANFATTIADLVSLGQQKMDAEIVRRLLSLLQESVPAGSDEYIVATGGLTREILDAAVREVRDAIRPDGAGPVPVTILGRAAMVDQISDFTGYAFEALEEIRLRGRLGTYRAANIVQVNNFADEDGVSFIPDNEMWVFGGTVGQFALYGGLQVKTWYENTVDYRHDRARRDLGGMINHPEYARRIVVP